ncbi:MAG: aldehyde dehydrogenase family protein, partial [Oscillospiraceae bacterium]
MNNAGMENAAVINELVANGRKALAALASYSQEQIDDLCKVCCEAFAAHAEELAAEAVAETGLGNVPDKIMKNTGSPDGVWYAIKNKKSVGIIGTDPRHHLTFVAHPKGIISCVIPTTNPNITILFNGVYALKGGNVILCAPHPRAKKSTVHTCQIFAEALKKAGAPDHIFQCVEEPNVELTQQMMSASDTVLGTGGPSMVKAAYSSGKPAYGVGPGNSQTIFDPDYDNLEAAVGQTIFGNKFDNGIICACNRSFITPKSISGKIVDSMKAQKVYYTDDPVERDKFRALLFPNGFGAINGKPVGQDVQKVAEMAGVKIPADTSIIVVKVDKYGADEPLCREKMVPLAVHIEAADVKDAVAIAKANLLVEGAGHSSVIHSNNQKLIEYAACTLPVSRFLVNCPGVFSANPALANGLCPTATLGCGSWAGCSVS